MKIRDKLGKFCNFDIDREYLYQKYIIEKILPSKIAKLLNISNHLIYDKLHQYRLFRKRTTRNKCIGCGVETYYHSIRCKKCYKKYQNTNKAIYVCHSCGIKIGRSKTKLCMSCVKIKYPIRFWLGKSNLNIIIKHHIDGNHKNNLKENELSITHSEHRSLHWKGYEYINYIGLPDDYLKEFCLKYKIINSKDKVDGRVMHHIDCNRKNNNDNNFMYLKDKGIHNKLHQEAYNYLVRQKKVIDYIDWFFLQKKKNNQMSKIKEESK